MKIDLIDFCIRSNIYNNGRGVISVHETIHILLPGLVADKDFSKVETLCANKAGPFNVRRTNRNFTNIRYNLNKICGNCLPRYKRERGLCP